jgi:fatty acid-binding protein DegV
LTERSGRAEGVGVEAAAEEGIPVLSMTAGELEVRATVRTTQAAVASMADYALGWTPSMPGGLRVAVGTSDASSAPVARTLTELLEGHGDVADVVQYRIGPSVGAHTGPGTAGLFVF